MELQPIETAPKIEGQPVLLRLENGVYVIASWEDDWWEQWIDLGPYLYIRKEPTHWAPLPEMPNEATS